MSTVKLTVQLQDEVLELEMPSVTTVHYACFRVAEALGEDPDDFEYQLVPVVNNGRDAYLPDLLVSEIQEPVLLVGRKRA